MKNRNNKNEKNISAAWSFFAVLGIITVMAWALPLRESVSEEEKRELASFPELKMESLADGSFFSGVDTWFSDTFTFRNTWISIADNIENLFGYGAVSIDYVAANDDVPVQTQTPEPVAALENAAEEPEVLNQPSEIQEEAVQQDEQTDAWGGNVLEGNDFSEGTAVLTIGDSGYWIPEYNQRNADRFINAMNREAAELEGKANFYTIIVPSNITYMFNRSDRDFMNVLPEEDLMADVFSSLDGSIVNVDIFSALVSHNSEYICFRTDHHWTALGAYYAYEKWCETAGVEPVSLDAYESFSYEGYLGTAYSNSNSKTKMRENPDTVIGYYPPGDIHLYIEDNSKDEPGDEKPLFRDMTGAPETSLFLTFLNGDYAKCTFVNNDITDGSACMIVKNSMGNMLSYYYTQHYQYVYVVDVRHYFNRSLSELAEVLDVDDVILAFNAGYIWSVGGSKLIDAFLQ